MSDTKREPEKIHLPERWAVLEEALNLSATNQSEFGGDESRRADESNRGEQQQDVAGERVAKP